MTLIGVASHHAKAFAWEMANRSRYKGRSTPAARPTAFRTFGEIRPLLNHFVLPVYGDAAEPPFEIICDTLDAAVAHRERLREADLAEFDIGM